jgi:integrase
MMSGKVKLVKIDSREGRAKLPVRGVPYYREVLGGLHLGYRKGARRGVWVVRRLVDGGYVAQTIAIADDDEPSDGKQILTFDEARQAALALAKDVAKATKGHAQRGRARIAPATIATALATYLGFLDRERKCGRNSRNYANTSILPQLGHVALRDLTKEMLSDWLFALAASPRKTRGKAGLLAPPVTDEEFRARRSSANRTYGVLRGALNMAFADGLVASDAAWRRVKPLREATAARVRRFTAEEMRALVDAAEGAFKPILTAALFTGARYGELTRLVIGDFERGSDSLLIRVAKSGKSRHIVLTKEACGFFSRLCAARASGELMLTKADGTPWGEGHQDRPMRRACKRAGVEHGGFHACRHSYASAAVEAGIPLMIVAQNLGHADISMLQRHYSHISDAHKREMIQGRMTPLNLDDSNVVALVRR